MKALLTLTSSLAFSTLLLAAYAQTPITEHDKPTPAKPTAKTAKGATGAKGAKSVGQKMVDKSKPTDSHLPVPPTKQ